MTERGKKGSGEWQINPKLPKEIKKGLGQSIWEKRRVTENQIAENERQLDEKVKELQQKKTLKKNYDKIKDMEKIEEKFETSNRR